MNIEMRLQAALQKTIEQEEKEMMIDPFAKGGPLCVAIKTVDIPGAIDSKSVKSQSSSTDGHSDSSRSLTSESSSPVSGRVSSDATSIRSLSSADCSTSHSRFGHRMDKPLPRIPVPSMVFCEPPPLITRKNCCSTVLSSLSFSDQRQRQNSSWNGHAWNFPSIGPPPNVPLPPIPGDYQKIGLLQKEPLPAHPIPGDVPEGIHSIPPRKRSVSKLDIPKKIDAEVWV
ncbi:hypothetical protein D9758_012200 [Tetrapyrgos nigripes]|uniref:Uncharacterized protein n=1 Tax=Tetrapyrgos nigripes TaxID=182062 RepID=A0A8H5FKT1_9AGAR|nr:hypothetical protein D9758_012200 [Tetrapyrgos nigripes]